MGGSSMGGSLGATHARPDASTVGAGLQNLGNSCFMNATLQCLAHSPRLHEALRKREHSKSCPRRSAPESLKPKAFCSACKLEFLIAKTFVPGATPFTPRSLADALPIVAKGFRLGRQEDAHEYMRYLLDHLTACLQPVWPVPKGVKEKPTLVQATFEGKLQSCVRCLGCGYESKTLDPFLDLSLELQEASGARICRSLTDALRRFTQAETLDVGNGYKCSGCGRLSRARKQFRIAAAPECLTIQLKRFSFGCFGGFGGNGGAGKISGHVAFDFTLDATPYCTEGGPTEGPVRYALYGVLVHDGYSTSSGHYYCYCKPCGEGAPNGTDAPWYLFNDSTVRRVQREEVARASAYILLYRRTSPCRAPPPEPEGADGGEAAAASGVAERGEAAAGFIGPAIGPAIGPSPRPPTKQPSSATQAKLAIKVVAAAAIGPAPAIGPPARPLGWPTKPDSPSGHGHANGVQPANGHANGFDDGLRPAGSCESLYNPPSQSTPSPRGKRALPQDTPSPEDGPEAARSARSAFEAVEAAEEGPMRKRKRSAAAGQQLRARLQASAWWAGEGRAAAISNGTARTDRLSGEPSWGGEFEVYRRLMTDALASLDGEEVDHLLESGEAAVTSLVEDLVERTIEASQAGEAHKARLHGFGTAARDARWDGGATGLQELKRQLTELREGEMAAASAAAVDSNSLVPMYD